MPDLDEINPHLALWRSENYESPEEKRWYALARQCKRIFGHSLDGDQAVDGYSLDYAYDAFEAGQTPQEYVASVRGQ